MADDSSKNHSRTKSRAGSMTAKARRQFHLMPLMGLSREEFAREAHRQSLAVANSPFEAEDQAFVDAISVWNNESFDKEWDEGRGP